MKLSNLAPAASAWKTIATRRALHEFQIIFLNPIFGPDVRVLPILCGSYFESIYRRRHAEEDDSVNRFPPASLGEIETREDHRLCWVLGVDMAHWEPANGDQFEPWLVRTKCWQSRNAIGSAWSVSRSVTPSLLGTGCAKTRRISSGAAHAVYNFPESAPGCGRHHRPLRPVEYRSAKRRQFAGMLFLRRGISPKIIRRYPLSSCEENIKNTA